MKRSLVSSNVLRLNLCLAFDLLVGVLTEVEGQNIKHEGSTGDAIGVL